MTQEEMNNRDLRCNRQLLEPSLFLLLLDVNFPIAKLPVLQRLQLTAWYINATAVEADTLDSDLQCQRC